MYIELLLIENNSRSIHVSMFSVKFQLEMHMTTISQYSLVQIVSVFILYFYTVSAAVYYHRELASCVLAGSMDQIYYATSCVLHA